MKTFLVGYLCLNLYFLCLCMQWDQLASDNLSISVDSSNGNNLQDKQLKSHSQKNVESEILREHIKKEREAAKAGKRPYYLKKCLFINPSPSFLCSLSLYTQV